MKKYDVTIWYTLPRWKTFTIEAENEQDARDKAGEILWDEDTSTWNDASDADVEMDIEASI